MIRLFGNWLERHAWGAVWLSFCGIVVLILSLVLGVNINL